MKTYLKLPLLFLSVLLLLSFAADTTYVYICKGPKSKCYLYESNCRGLSRCSTNIYKVTLDCTKDLGQTLCGLED